MFYLNVMYYNKTNIDAGYLAGLNYMYSVNLTTNYFTQVPDGVKESSITNLDLSHNKIDTYVNERPWKNQYMKRLSLKNNTITKIYQNTFANLTALQILLLQNNEIQEIEQNSFITNINLMMINLGLNKLQTLDENLFQKMTNLQKVVLHYNEINYLEKKTFWNQHNLEILYLNNNKLTTLHENMFTNLKSLNILLLSGNSIYNIHADLLANTQQLNSLAIANNPIEDFDASIFRNLQRLAVIDLSYLNITRLPDLSALTSITMVMILSTKIDHIYECELKPLKSLKGLFIAGCPLICDCDLRWLRRWVDEVMLPWVDKNKAIIGADWMSQMYCSKPFDLTGENFLDVEPPSFECQDNQVPMYCYHASSSNSTITRLGKI